MSKIRKISDIPHLDEPTLETWVVTDPGSQIKAVKIGDIVDFVAKEAQKKLIKKLNKS